MSLSPVPQCTLCKEYEGPDNPTVVVGKSEDDEAPKFARPLICLRCTVLAHEAQKVQIRGGITYARGVVVSANETIDVLTKAAADLGIDLNTPVEPGKGDLGIKMDGPMHHDETRADPVTPTFAVPHRGPDGR